MDRKTQADEMRRMSAAPDYMLGSAHAITEDGVVVAVSATGSQLGPLASGAGRVILVVGSQKIVPDLDTAFRRVREHLMPWEDARLRASAGIGTTLGKILLLEREFRPAGPRSWWSARRSGSERPYPVREDGSAVRVPGPGRAPRRQANLTTARGARPHRTGVDWGL